jgi:hypothetical protein
VQGRAAGGGRRYPGLRLEAIEEVADAQCNSLPNGNGLVVIRHVILCPFITASGRNQLK